MRLHALASFLLLAAPDAPPLPPAVRRALDAAYPGWRFATVTADVRRALSPGQRPEWVSGDFDGDGRRDYAVQIVRGAPAITPPDSAQLTVALLRRPRATGGYALYVVKAGPAHEGIWLARGARGGSMPDVEADTAIVYRTDAIEIGYGQEAGESCVFVGGRFRCVVTGD